MIFGGVRDMTKKLLSSLIVAASIITAIPMAATSSTAVTRDIIVNLERKNITDERLAEMVENGEIPQGVTHLTLRRNLISDLTPLSELSNLRVLLLGSNQISDLSPLAELNDLLILNLTNNQITDITPLAGLTNLTNLTLGNYMIAPTRQARNRICNLSPLTELTNLEGLDLFGNQITDITLLSGLTNLLFLNLGSNQITDVTPLQNLTSLWFLQLQNNQIEDVMPLAWLTKMETETTAELLRGNPVASDHEQLASLAEARARNTTRTTLTLGHVLGTEPYTVHDAIEILRHVAGLPSVLDDGCSVTIMAALVISDKHEGPGVPDAIAILRNIVGLPSALDSPDST
jgi:Leucine-rich repeat (LRR) protein